MCPVDLAKTFQLLFLNGWCELCFSGATSHTPSSCGATSMKNTTWAALRVAPSRALQGKFVQRIFEFCGGVSGLTGTSETAIKIVHSSKLVCFCTWQKPLTDPDHTIRILLSLLQTGESCFSQATTFHHTCQIQGIIGKQVRRSLEDF